MKHVLLMIVASLCLSMTTVVKVKRLDFYNIENYSDGNVASFLTMLEKGDINGLNENLADTNIVNLEAMKTKCQMFSTKFEIDTTEKIKTVHQPGVNPNNNNYWIERTYYRSNGQGRIYEHQVRIIMDRHYRIKNIIFFEEAKIVKRDALLDRN